MIEAVFKETSNCGNLAFTGPFGASPICGFCINAILTVSIAI